MNMKWMMVAAVASGAMLLTPDFEARSQGFDLSIGAEASAQTFGGKIKNIRIKKRRTGSGFWIKPLGVSSKASDLGSVDTTLTIEPSEGGQDTVVLDVDVQSRGNSLRRVASDAGTFALPGDAINFTIYAARDDEDNWDDDDWEEAEPGYTPEERVSLELGGDASTGLGDGGWKIRARLTQAGALRAVVFHENKDVETRIVGITYQVEGSDERRLLPIVEYRQRWSENLDIAPEVFEGAARIQAETRLLDTSGQVVATRLEDVQLEGDDGLDVGVRRVNLGETRDGDTRMTTWTASDGGASSLQTQVVDTQTGEVALSTLDEAPVRTVRSFDSSLSFDPGDSPAGYIYLVLFDLIDANGDPVGQQYEAELTIPATLGPDGIYGEEVFAFFADGQGAVALIPQEGSEDYAVEVLWQGDGVQNVQGVNVIFEEPFEGPAPLDTEAQTQLVAQFDKWVQKGGAPTPESASISALLADANGQVIEEIATSGGGDGAVYRTEGNGKGTKKSNIKFPFIPRELL